MDERAFTSMLPIFYMQNKTHTGFAWEIDCSVFVKYSIQTATFMLQRVLRCAKHRKVNYSVQSLCYSLATTPQKQISYLHQEKYFLTVAHGQKAKAHSKNNASNIIQRRLYDAQNTLHTFV